MQIDDNGDYLTFESDKQNIDYYIQELCRFKTTILSLLRKDPETRQAILGASYKDILCLRVQAHDILRYMEEIENRRILRADQVEVIAAAEEHPATFGND